MTKFTVSIPVVSYYEVEIEAETPNDVVEQISHFTPSMIEDRGGHYTGWDIDFSNVGFDGLVKESQTA
jgi:hypothetical protein